MYVASVDPASSLQQEVDTPGWQFAVIGGILGWVLDAFDFFVVVFLFNELSAKFQVSKSAIVVSLTLTLAMRPVGALLFGWLADRFGRRRPLMVCVLYFSTMTVLSGFAPSYLAFMIFRALYGIGMGGYWGIGAAYSMESAPRRKRGFLSGMMQGGYPFGYLMASIAIQTVPPRFGWQAMFVVGSVVAVLIVLITLKAPESDAWKLHRSPSIWSMGATLMHNIRPFAYLLLVMTVMTCLSHGTQDLYPDFLKGLPWVTKATVFGMKATYGIPVLYNVGAIIGAIIIGGLSERIGRRYALMIALTLCLISIPAWAFGGTLVAIVLGSFCMQTGVQGAFGVIPAHLNELSPDAIRGLFTGFVYQLGVLFSSPLPALQNLLEKRLGYSWALTSFELCVIASLMLIFGFGPENRGRSFKTRSPIP
ncbi:MFS transporter [Edaphobacter bradus]|uniref:MFS transporter n=1 Tax=Edaphobacter bradus TaxID=2259016 RepID=UPI0021DF74A3|nr:MFS transporter [Edaphobacter bradus]